MISDAASIVDVETHVLRYWEEELELDIPRNEMGHRYYTKENINQFQKIKELKALGYQLRTIKSLIHETDNYESNITEPSAHNSTVLSTERALNPERLGNPQCLGNPQGVENPERQVALEKSGNVHIEKMTSEDWMNQFRELMSYIVGQAIALNNEELSITIGNEVGERVLKEMNYLMREQESAQEERNKKLDAAISGNVRKKSALFGKKKKSDKAVAKKPAHA